MQHTLTTVEKAILVGVVADVERLSAIDERQVKNWETPFLREAILDARQHRVARCDPSAWLGGELSAAERVRVSRSYARLERAGLVEKLAFGIRGTVTTHLRVTDAGQKLVEQLQEAGDGD